MLKLFIYDIETRPNKGYFWGVWKQNIPDDFIIENDSIICWAGKFVGKKEVFWASTRTHEYEAMMEELWELLDQADAVITYNGKSFDEPWVMRAFLELGWPPPSPCKHVDLYRITSRSFRFARKRLKAILAQLKLQNKKETGGLSLWIEYMKGMISSQKKMESYNRQDVVVLEDLYNLVLPYIKVHPNHALYKDTERPVCTNCGSTHVVRKGKAYTAAQVYQRYVCRDCGTNMRGRTSIVTKEKRQNILMRST